MSNDALLVIWLIAVILLGAWNAYWGIIEWRSGAAKIAFWPIATRSLQPVSFALILAGRILGVVVPTVLFALVIGLTISKG